MLGPSYRLNLSQHSSVAIKVRENTMTSVGVGEVMVTTQLALAG